MATTQLTLPPGELQNCRSCLSRLGDEIAALPGVRQVVSPDGGSLLTVDYDPVQVSEERLRASAANLAVRLERQFAHENLAVDGMDCADCALTLENAIRTLPGIATARVNFAAASLVVEYDRERLHREEMLGTVRRLGYDLPGVDGGEAVTTSFVVSGLDCADCAIAVERNLSALRGVEAAHLNFSTATLEVKHSSHVRPSDIANVVEQSGYGVASVRAGAQTGERTFWVRNRRAVLTVAAGVALLLGLAVGWLGLPDAVSAEQLSHGLYLIAIGLGGFHVARAGLYGFWRSRTLDMNVLMSVAVVGALAIGEWEEAATVVFLFALGNSLEGYTMDRARGAIRSLLALAPNTARVRRDGREVNLPAEAVAVGEVVLVRPGEKVAVDGQVVGGASSVNQAPVTGESLPVEKGLGDEVFAGSLNERGYLEVRASRSYADNTISRIIHMVEEAQGQRAQAQRFVDEFSRYYTPAVMLVALVVATVPWLLFAQPFETWFYRALVLLVIACPCALVISTPVAIVSAIARAARLGVLVKGGARLEEAGEVRVLAFDKTGTLTVGRPEVTDLVALDGLDEPRLLWLASALECRSEHPLAAAVQRRAEVTGGAHCPPEISQFAALPGRGVEALLDGQTYFLGNRRLFQERGVPLDGDAERIEALEAEGKTVLLLGTEQRLLGYLAVADRLRPGARDAVAALRRVGVERIVLLTGDQESTARAIASAVGADDFRANLLPDDKVAALQELRRRYGPIAMVGDGVNDAPALASANVGIAMGAAGTDVALETADIALMADDLDKVGFAMGLARQARATIRMNVAFALALKAIFLGLTFFGVTTLWLAILADTGASLLVTLNGMRLLGYGRRFARPDDAHLAAHEDEGHDHDAAEACNCGHEHAEHDHAGHAHEAAPCDCGHDHDGNGQVHDEAEVEEAHSQSLRTRQ
ncbi:MAG: heavy metal translocating P-type ATPase [Chloroflexota bacterium]